MIEQEYINKERIKAWIYMGVDLELDLAGAEAEVKLLYEQDPLDHDSITYNNKQKVIIQRKLELVNERITKIKGYPND